MVLVHKDKEALCWRLHKAAQALVHRGVPVPDLLQHNAHDDHIIHRRMLQKVDLQGQGAVASTAFVEDTDS